MAKYNIQLNITLRTWNWNWKKNLTNNIEDKNLIMKT